MPPACRRSSTPNAQSAFSLIELLVAMLIIAIALLGVMALQVSTLRSHTTGRHRERAIHLATSLLDRIQAQAQIHQMQVGYQVPNPTGYADAFFYGGAGRGDLYYPVEGSLEPVADAGQFFHLEWQRLHPREATTSTILQEFRVRVRWREGTRPGTNEVLWGQVVLNRLVGR